MYTRVAYPVAPAVAGLLTVPVGCIAGYVLGHSIGDISTATASLIAVGPLLVVALGTVWFSDRRLSSFLAGSSFSLGLAFLALSANVLTAPQPAALLAIIIASIALAALGGCVSFAIDAFLRTNCVEFIAQDGTRCPRCAYRCSTHGQSNRCSECGSCVSEILRRGEFGARAIRLLNRRSRYLLMIAIAIVLGPTTILVIVSAGRFGRFTQWASQVGGGEVYTTMLDTGENWMDADWECSGTLLPIPADSGKFMLVTYAPHVLGRQPLMQVRLVWRFQPNPAFPASFMDGLRPILCNLSADQADELIGHSVPATLYGAMLDASKAAGWPLALPPPGPGGAITLFATGTSEPVAIPADALF